LVYNW